MIRIVFIIDSLSFSGGAENQLRRLACALDKKRFDVSVISLDVRDGSVNDLAKAGVKVFFVPQKGVVDLRCLCKLAKLLKKVRPDIVNTALFTADTYGRISARFARRPKVITSIRSLDSWKKMRHRAVDNILKQGTDAFTANSKAVQFELIQRYGIDDKKIKVIYNGVDVDLFQKRARSKELCDALTIPYEAPVVLSVARFTREKDHETLILAAQKVLQERNDVIFVLVGRGQLKEQVKQRLQGAGLFAHFRFPEPTTQIQKFYNLANVGVLTSLYEGLSNFIIEAMASEVPVVATAVGGNPELIEEGVTGFLTPVETPNYIAEKLLWVLKHPERAQQMGDQARRQALETLTFSQMVSRYQAFYTHLCEGNFACLRVT